MDRLPVDLWRTPEIATALRQHCGVPEDFAMWRVLKRIRAGVAIATAALCLLRVVSSRVGAEASVL